LITTNVRRTSLLIGFSAQITISYISLALTLWYAALIFSATSSSNLKQSTFPG